MFAVIVFFGLNVLAINAVTQSDLNGLDEQYNILFDLSTALKIADYGTAQFLAVEAETAADLYFIGTAFTAVAKIINSDVTDDAIKAKMLNSFDSIYQSLAIVADQLDQLSNVLTNRLVYMQYSTMRQEILYVQSAYKNLIDYTNGTYYGTYYLDNFIAVCQNHNLFETILSIDNLICGNGGQVSDDVIADYNRTQYSYFLRLVIGDVINAATLRESCLGVANAPDAILHKEGNEMIAYINQITNAFQSGDNQIATGFMPEAKRIVQQIIDENQKKDFESQAQLAQLALQDKFNWLQWAQMVSQSHDGNSNFPDDIPDYGSYGFFDILDEEKGLFKDHRDWVSFWTIDSPKVDWRPQLEQMTQREDGYFCCNEKALRNDSGKSAKCLIEEINNPNSGINGTRAYYAYIEKPYNTDKKFGSAVIGNSGCYYFSFCNNAMYGMVCAGPD